VHLLAMATNLGKCTLTFMMILGTCMQQRTEN